MSEIRKLFRKYGEVVRYIIVGGMTTVVSLGSYYLCVITVLNPDELAQLQIANIISWIAAVTFAYVTNRRYVFASKNNNKLREASAFFLSRISTLIIDMLSMFVMVNLLYINDKFAKLIVQVIVFIGNYLLSKFIVFKKKDNSGY